jgi:hypothetical protein
MEQRQMTTTQFEAEPLTQQDCLGCNAPSQFHKTDLAHGDQDGETKHSRRHSKVYRRRQIDPTTCERDYSQEEIDFMRALDAYKRKSGRMFPTCSEILEVIRTLGYVRITSDVEVAIG